MSWMKKLRSDSTEWLLDSNPWTRYCTLTDLLGKPETDEEVGSAYSELVADPQVLALIAAAEDWFPESVTRHNVPTLSHYRLRMLVDMGLKKRSPCPSGIAAQSY